MKEVAVEHYFANGATAPAPRETLDWALGVRAQMVDLKFCELVST
jgi:hypothetical protein